MQPYFTAHNTIRCIGKYASVDTKLPMDYGSDEESILPDDNLGYDTNSMTEPQLC
jgi:hypothetical protein